MGVAPLPSRAHAHTRVHAWGDPYPLRANALRGPRGGRASYRRAGGGGGLGLSPRCARRNTQAVHIASCAMPVGGGVNPSGDASIILSIALFVRPAARNNPRNTGLRVTMLRFRRASFLCKSPIDTSGKQAYKGVVLNDL